MSNFREIEEIFLSEDAAMKVRDEDGLEKTLIDLLENSARRSTLSNNGQKVIEENSGAIDKTIEEISKYVFV